MTNQNAAPTPGGENPRQTFYDRATDLLPPPELANDDSGDPDWPEPAAARYKVDDATVIVEGWIAQDATRYKHVNARVITRLDEPDSKIFYATRERHFALDGSLEDEGEFEESVILWGYRGIRLDQLIRFHPAYRDMREELEEVIGRYQSFKKEPLTDHYGEIMPILDACGPDNFIEPPDPNDMMLF